MKLTALTLSGCMCSHCAWSTSTQVTSSMKIFLGFLLGCLFLVFFEVAISILFMETSSSGIEGEAQCLESNANSNVSFKSYYFLLLQRYCY